MNGCGWCRLCALPQWGFGYLLIGFIWISVRNQLDLKTGLGWME